MPNTNNRKLALVILDGWGIGPKDNTNPLYSANLSNFDKIKTSFPCLSLQASGLAVGLPWNEEGNSEIGHLTIGAGRIVYQTIARIDDAINNGTFFENPILLEAFTKAKQAGTSVCFAGLLGDGIVHASIKHLLALINLAEKLKVNYKLHLFTDGRDGSPKGGLELLSHLPTNKIGSISGRFYAMDRDNHLERTSAAYKNMTDGKPTSDTPSNYIEKSYAAGITDEFIRPACFNQELLIHPSDSIIFFNFRKDRMRQLSKMFRESLPDTYIASFVEYNNGTGVPAAFSANSVPNPLPKIIADHKIAQLRIAESEKRAHITYFFSGEQEEPFPNEFRVIIPSRKITSHDQAPEMRAEEITARIITAVEEGSYGFIFANYANPDIVAHTGNFDATIKAVELIDKELGLITSACLKTGTILVITADHGNAEKLINTRTGEKDTKHNPSPVPFIVIDHQFARIRTSVEITENENLVVGSLCDIAPTILKLMGIAKPVEMTGQDLTPYL